MEQYNLTAEIEEKVAKIFLMNRKGLHQQHIFKTHIQMPVKH